jgi:hypothetical protein
LMKSSAEFTHITDALMSASFADGSCEKPLIEDATLYLCH